MKNAAARLERARLSAKNAGITDSPLICLGGSMWALFPWLGTYAFFALERFLKLKCGERLGLKGLDSARPYYIQFKMKASPKNFLQFLQKKPLLNSILSNLFTRMKCLFLKNMISMFPMNLYAKDSPMVSSISRK